MNMDLFIKDLEEFETKYGIDREQYRDDESAMYDSDAYKSKLAAYKTEKEADWIKKKNQLLKDYDVVISIGKTVYYSLADSHIQMILNQGMEHIRE